MQCSFHKERQWIVDLVGHYEKRFKQLLDCMVGHSFVGV